MKPSVAAAIGAAAFVLAQGMWSVGHAFAGWRGEWMLKRFEGIALGLGIVAVAAACVYLYRREAKTLLARALWVGLGATGAMTLALMIIGPGNLWPIVIVFDGGMLLAASLAGAALGAVISGLRPG